MLGIAFQMIYNHITHPAYLHTMRGRTGTSTGHLETIIFPTMLSAFSAFVSQARGTRRTRIFQVFNEKIPLYVACSSMVEGRTYNIDYISYTGSLSKTFLLFSSLDLLSSFWCGLSASTKGMYFFLRSPPQLPQLRNCSCGRLGHEGWALKGKQDGL